MGFELESTERNEVNRMSDINQTVFRSFASRQAEAARAADIEVWFDQSELVGGDTRASRAVWSFELFHLRRCRIRGVEFKCVLLRSAGVLGREKLIEGGGPHE